MYAAKIRVIVILTHNFSPIKIFLLVWVVLIIVEYANIVSRAPMVAAWSAAPGVHWCLIRVLTTPTCSHTAPHPVTGGVGRNISIILIHYNYHRYNGDTSPQHSQSLSPDKLGLCHSYHIHNEWWWKEVKKDRTWLSLCFELFFIIFCNLVN